MSILLLLYGENISKKIEINRDQALNDFRFATLFAALFAAVPPHFNTQLDGLLRTHPLQSAVVPRSLQLRRLANEDAITRQNPGRAAINVFTALLTLVLSYHSSWNRIV